MKKVILGLMVGVLLIAGSLFAADGDLIVNGNLGVGTTSPNDKLEVSVSTATTAIRITSTAGDGRPHLEFFRNTSTSIGLIQAGLTDGFGVGGDNIIIDNPLITGKIILSGGGSTDLVVNGSNHYVGIGTANPNYPLHMASGAYVTTGGAWTNASSRTYKENIETLSTEKAAEALKALNPVEFIYKNNKEKHVGFIAEDVPELVATPDRKGLSPMDIVAVLTKVVQEQQKTIENQNKAMAELSSAVTQLQAAR